MIQTDQRLPVTLITGFLGSGKTTLLSSLLRRPELGRTAVIINEFGEVPLDQALIERRDGHLVVLSGGCLCCAIGGDVTTTLLDLYQRRDALPFDRVILETSGLADPGPILAPLIQTPELTALFRVAGVVAVVDALQGLRELGRQRVSVKQVALADRIVLTKSDIAAPLAVARLQDQLASLNPWAALVTANHGAVQTDWLFDPTPAPARPVPPAAGHDHPQGIASFCLWFDQPLTWEPLAQALTALSEAHGETLLRIKGVLNLEGRPAALHGVQHFLHPPVPLAAWPDDERRSRVVFITEHLAEAKVRAFFPSLVG